MESFDKCDIEPSSSISHGDGWYIGLIVSEVAGGKIKNKNKQK
mgnify:CR=1 FL=1